MNQEQRRTELIRQLLTERPEYQRIDIPASSEEQKHLLRSLFNVRLPGKIDDAFLKIQDEYLTEATRNDMISYAVCYGEFMYQAGSWKYPRRVVCKVEKPTDQLIHMYTFIVTNMDSAPGELIRFYCKRGSKQFLDGGQCKPLADTYPGIQHI